MTAACPFCMQPFDDGTAFRLHVEHDHGVALRMPRVGKASSAMQRWRQGLRFVPLWFVLPLSLGLFVVVVLSIEASPWSPLAVYGARLALLPSLLVLANRVSGH